MGVEATGELSTRPDGTGRFQERGGLFTLAGIRGADGGGPLSSAQDQMAAAFANLRAAADVAGVALSELGRVTVLTPDPANRQWINPPWLGLFPDDGDRPARKTTHVPLPAGVHVELMAEGVRGERRRSLEIEGVRHKDPLPMGAVLGRHVFSSVVVPDVPGGGPATGVAAIEQTYANARALLAAAGGSLDDVCNVWTYLGMWDLHPEMVDIWVDNFPDEASRPSRKTFYYPRATFQLQLEAVLGGPRSVLEIPGIGHHDPIPMGAVTGGLITSSGVDGRDPETNTEPRGVAAQSERALLNLALLMEQAGGQPEQLYQVSVLLGELRYLQDFLPAWQRAFPDPDNAPALQPMTLGLPARDMLVQVIGRGLLPVIRP